ncbi:Cobalt-zinc-cadmium resistance protein CzcA [Pseudobythopirellula maris]|uniref:Cobalt-zinc-cadmium resistance protein CzcA n=1 Tax=Pseudobythopirellula maris TaxID=2527991 RepID=A0A5C5ZRD2_9BACT|nr:CusA/CzcA family heavy metal efflux RND transporter [Pseudobythopirellula maris]TWT89796.1 Cobalt-zinc-cadmium resistance protein CzcA [Pseudobythopirellula maris]
MLNWIIEASLRRRSAVVMLVLLVAAAGVASLRQLDIDAFPDTTPVQIQINTVAPALTPEEVERQLTFPVEQAIGGLPGLDEMRSVSKFGFSQVTVVFEDGVDVYFARQLVGERLATVNLPLGVDAPQMGPVATGLGEVLHYVLTYDGYDLSRLPQEEREQKLTELRTLHDWVVRPQLRTVPGVAEVNTWGGYEKQHQVLVDPDRLIRYGLTFDHLVEALERNNRNVGGGSITRGAEMLLVQGQGRTVTADEIGQVVLAAEDGVPVRVSDVAEVVIGHAIRRGAVTAGGLGEVVMGLGFSLMGENTHQVTTELKERLDLIRRSLPPGVKITTVYDRTELVAHVLDTARKNLFEGGLLVVAVLFMFLGSLRAGLIVAVAIPLSMLCAFSGMLQFGVAASLLSLGAIDFGLVVDSSVVMVENCARKLGDSANSGRSRLAIVRDAALEVRRPTLFGELIIMIVYLPILTLEGVEGKLFRPMALTVIFALAGSMLMSMTLMPVLASLVLPRRSERREPLPIRLAKRLYRPVLHATMRHKSAVIALALTVLFVAFGMIAPNLGSEFVPQLSEGAMAINVVRLAGTSLEESTRYNTEMERAILAAFPDEVAHVWSRIGSAEIATDPMGVELTDVFITLHPRSQWKRASTQTELTAEIQRVLRDLPGQRLAFSQPIKLRLDEIATGVRSDVAVKLFGDDYDEMVRIAGLIERVLASVPGGADVAADQVTGQPVLQVKVDQEAIARYGVPATAVLDLVEAVGGRRVGDVYEGQYRFPLVVRLPSADRASPEAIESMLVATPAGERLPLGRLAEVRLVEGPSQIAREWGQRRISIQANVRGRDVGSFVAEAQQKIAQQIQLPGGRYHLSWGGQFEHMERARARLMIVVPIVLATIFGLLYLTYHNWVDALRVFTGVPFAWTGGVFALWVRGMPFSISAAIGFIALSGVAVLDDMLLVSTIKQLRARGRDLESAVEEAAMTRLRPVLMTTLVAALGFVPMALSTGMGAEVQRPLATVVIGGVISAMVMSLLVLRVLYVVFPGAGRSRQAALAEADTRATAAPDPVGGTAVAPTKTTNAEQAID